MVFFQMEYWYRRIVFLLLKQIVPLLRQITLPAVHMQISRFIYKTDTTCFSKASVTLSVTGFPAIASTGLLCFFFMRWAAFLCCSFTCCTFCQWPGSFINLYFFTALPFFLFSMFFMFIGVFHVFWFLRF